MNVASQIERLPHWARVAFAARCLQWVMPIFDGAWPDAIERRREALATVLRLAGESARLGAAAEGLEDATTQAVITAGAALLPIYPKLRASSEPTPNGEAACLAASFSAKVAEWAARAASGSSEESARAALEAYTFARDAGDHAGVSIQESLDLDFAKILRLASRNRRRDDIPFPLSLFDETGPTESKWRFWGRS